MKVPEMIGTILVLLVLIATPAGVWAYQASGATSGGCQEIIMRTYENGNPMPEETYLKKGQKVCLRLTSYDVTHGFNISDLGIDAGEIHAGKWTKIEFTPTETGTFSYVCTIQCSPMHSKVRGKLVVTD